MRITNKFNLPEPFVNAVKQLFYDLEPQPNRFSVSSLEMPPRIIQLFRRHWTELEFDVSDRIQSILGTAFHWLMELGATQRHITENRLSIVWNGIELTGKPDCIEGGTLWDYKTTSPMSVRYWDGECRQEWIYQVNVYKYLLDKNHFPIERLKIFVVFPRWNMSEAKLFKSWYPQQDWKIIDVPILKTEEVEKYIDERLQLHIQAQQLPENKLPLCSPDERWAKEEYYAVKSDRLKFAKQRVYVRDYPSRKEAETKAKELCSEFAKKDKKRGKWYIEYNKSEDLRCLHYCDVCKFCDYWRQEYGKENS